VGCGDAGWAGSLADIKAYGRGREETRRDAHPVVPLKLHSYVMLGVSTTFVYAYRSANRLTSTIGVMISQQVIPTLRIFCLRGRGVPSGCVAGSGGAGAGLHQARYGQERLTASSSRGIGAGGRGTSSS